MSETRAPIGRVAIRRPHPVEPGAGGPVAWLSHHVAKLCGANAKKSGQKCCPAERGVRGEATVSNVRGSHHVTCSAGDLLGLAGGGAQYYTRFPVRKFPNPECKGDSRERWLARTPERLPRTENDASGCALDGQPWLLAVASGFHVSWLDFRVELHVPERGLVAKDDRVERGRRALEAELVDGHEEAALDRRVDH